MVPLEKPKAGSCAGGKINSDYVWFSIRKEEKIPLSLDHSLKPCSENIFLQDSMAFGQFPVPHCGGPLLKKSSSQKTKCLVEMWILKNANQGKSFLLQDWDV